MFFGELLALAIFAVACTFDPVRDAIEVLIIRIAMKRPDMEFV